MIHLNKIRKTVSRNTNFKITLQFLVNADVQNNLTFSKVRYYTLNMLGQVSKVFCITNVRKHLRLKIQWSWPTSKSSLNLLEWTPIIENIRKKATRAQGKIHMQVNETQGKILTFGCRLHCQTRTLVVKIIRTYQYKLYKTNNNTRKRKMNYCKIFIIITISSFSHCLFILCLLCRFPRLWLLFNKETRV